MPRRGGRQFQSIHRIADRRIPEMARGFLKAVDEFRDELSLDAVRDLIERNLDPVALPFSLFDDALLDDWRPLVFEIQEKVAERTADFDVQKQDKPIDTVGTEFGFDEADPRAIRNAETFAANLVAEVSANTKMGIRAIIAEGQRGRLTVDEMARRIREIVGLTERESKSVEAFRRGLEARGDLNPRQIEERTQRFYRRKLNQRARRIARNETLNAAQSGRQELWRQARDKGFLDTRRTVRVWIVAPDERVCPICAPMQGQKRGLEEQFQSPVGPAALHPPIHIQCRCDVRLEFGDPATINQDELLRI